MCVQNKEDVNLQARNLSRLSSNFKFIIQLSSAAMRQLDSRFKHIALINKQTWTEVCKTKKLCVYEIRLCYTSHS